MVLPMDLKLVTRFPVGIVLLALLLSVSLQGNSAGAATAVVAQASSPLLQAKPKPITLDLTRTAVIVVDMQNDFGSKGGLFDLMGIDRTEIQKVVAPTARVLAAARKAGLKIIYLKMTDVGVMLPGPDGKKHAVLVRDTWNTEILPALKPEPDDIQIYKHRFSGFFETELDAELKKLGVSRLVFTGCTTSVCVESTVRDAFFRDYSCVVLADCTAEPCGAEFSRSNHEASLYLIEKRFGSVSSSSEFVKTIEALLAVETNVSH
jgi:ureidoacrylate peracid hydrolase